MKIAIVTYSLMAGGIETVIFNQAEFFIKQGHEVTVFETLQRGTWVGYFTKNEIKVVSIIPNPLFSKKKHAKKILKRLKEFEVLLVHDSPYCQSILGMLPEKTISIQILHSELDSMIENAIGNFGQWNRIVYVGPHLKDLLLKREGISIEYIKNIPNGIVIPDSELKKDACRGKSRFIYIGRLEHIQKAVLLIPDIIRNVLLKEDIEVVNVFGGGKSYNALKRRIQQLSLDKKIRLNGPVEHEKVNAILQEHDYLLLPSFFEGHPIVLLEAMANRVIPFVSDLSGRTDFVVEHGVNGFLCKPADIDSFSSIIIEALGRTDLEQIADRSRATVIEKFSAEAMGKKYLDLIEEEKCNPRVINRSHEIFIDILGDLPLIPIIMIRPVRKFLRILQLWKERDTGS